jgi:tripartite-type tricarboxylate transporter receptor subunit TctC
MASFAESQGRFAVIRRRSVLAAASLPIAARAQPAGWPNRPVRLLVPFPPGGTSDVVGRLLGAHYQAVFGQPFTVENRAGAGGVVGSSELARAAPDGYTIGIGTISSHAINPVFLPNVPYDNIRGFEHVSLLVSLPNVLVVHPARVPASDLAGFIAFARANPGRIDYGSAGIGTSQHLSGELFALLAGVEMVHVPYRGGGPMAADLLSGKIACSFENATLAIQYVQQGAVKALGVTSPDPWPLISGVPPISSALPGYSVLSWQALFTPAGVDRGIVQALWREAKVALEKPDVRATLERTGTLAVAMPPDEFARFVVQETERWRDVIRRANIRPE